MKTCSKCGEEKAFDCFHKSRQQASGLAPRCKTCRANDNAEYREKNRERINARQRSPEGRAAVKSTREKNIEHYREKHRKWIKDNKEQQTEYHSRKWRERDDEWRDARMAKRREERLNNGDAIRDRENAWRLSQGDAYAKRMSKYGKKYYLKNSELYKSRAKRNTRRYTAELGNSYVAAKLRRTTGVKNPPQGLIELKRIQLKIHRALK